MKFFSFARGFFPQTFPPKSHIFPLFHIFFIMSLIITTFIVYPKALMLLLIQGKEVEKDDDSGSVSLLYVDVGFVSDLIESQNKCKTLKIVRVFNVGEWCIFVFGRSLLCIWFRFCILDSK